MGVPDSVFGTAWPAIYADFSLPISFGSFVTVIISCGTTISSAMGARLINRFGTEKVSLISTLLTAVALFGFAVSPSIWTMCFFAIPLGIGAGSIDVALNNYVSLHYSASHMSFLHCFYGVGVVISPYVLSLVISGSGGWRGGYRITGLIQLAISLIILLTLPIWKKAHGDKKEEMAAEVKTLSFMEALRVPGVKYMCAMFITSCAIESTMGGWGSTFLVEYKHLTVENAARVVMIYYIGLTLGRFLSGVIARWLHSKQIIKIAETILAVAIAIMLLPFGAVTAAVGMFLLGLSIGPLFPNFNYLTPENFGRDISQSVMGVQMSTAYVGIMLAPPLFSLLGQLVGMWLFPVYILILYLVMLFANRKFNAVMKRKQSENM